MSILARHAEYTTFGGRIAVAVVALTIALMSSERMDKHLDAVRRRALFSPVSTDRFAPASALVRVNVAAKSHRGRETTNHDDHYLVVRLSRHEETLLTSLADVDVPPQFHEYAYAAVVANGIGRDGAGAVAARLAITTLVQLELRFGRWDMRIDPQTASTIEDRSRRFYRAAHEAVVRWYRAHLDIGRIAAAVTGIYSAGNHLFVAHTGHSRCYVFRNGLLTQLTRDHTLRERLASSPLPTSVGRGLEDAGHVVTNAVGGDVDAPLVVVEHFRLAHDDLLLLCTNGLTDVLSDDEIADTLASRRTPTEQCGQLVDAALAKGGTDNITVVLAEYHIPDLPDDRGEETERE